VACSETSEPEALEPVDFNSPLVDDGAVARIALEPGLEQHIRIRPRRIHPGDQISIRSVIRNESNSYKTGEALVCHLEIRTNMEYESMDPLILCFAYSITFRLAPGDSLVLSSEGTVKSRPGVYAMVVRHLLRPDIDARIRVRVYPRDDGNVAGLSGGG
jgi:hypothetical protein